MATLLLLSVPLLFSQLPNEVKAEGGTVGKSRSAVPAAKAKKRTAAPSPPGTVGLEPEKIRDPATADLTGLSQIVPPAIELPTHERSVKPVALPTLPPDIQQEPSGTFILIRRRTVQASPDAGVVAGPYDGGVDLAPHSDAGALPPSDGPVPDGGAPGPSALESRPIVHPTPAQRMDARPAPEPEAKAPVQFTEAVLDQIRLEIKRRLSVFQLCADAARRRGVETSRRLEATWMIDPDGNVKALRIMNVGDPAFALCLQRVGNQPLAVRPGTDLTIPTPIVFVR